MDVALLPARTRVKLRELVVEESALPGLREKPLYLRGRQGPEEIVALHPLASQLVQPARLTGALDAFRDHSQPQRRGEVYHHSDYGYGLRVFSESLNEALV
jgi:hypothetical protein